MLITTALMAEHLLAITTYWVLAFLEVSTESSARCFLSLSLTFTGEIHLAFIGLKIGSSTVTPSAFTLTLDLKGSSAKAASSSHWLESCDTSVLTLSSSISPERFGASCPVIAASEVRHVDLFRVIVRAGVCVRITIGSQIIILIGA